MPLPREYLIPVFDEVATRNPGEIEFRQSVWEVLERFLGRRSEARVMRSCQSLITDLYRHLGDYNNAPANDVGVGVGGRVIVYSDPASYIVDEAGIGLKRPNEMKNAHGSRIADCAYRCASTRFMAVGSTWGMACKIALPCATRNEIFGANTARLIKNGHPVAFEGANLPISLDEPFVLREAGVRFTPSNAANAGGVAASALEMQPNASRDHWTFELTKERLARSCAPNATTASRRSGNTMRRTASSPGSPSPTTPKSRTLCCPSDSSRGRGRRQ